MATGYYVNNEYESVEMNENPPDVRVMNGYVSRPPWLVTATVYTNALAKASLVDMCEAP